MIGFMMEACLQRQAEQGLLICKPLSIRVFGM